jgi:hypothetical protein
MPADNPALSVLTGCIQRSGTYSFFIETKIKPQRKRQQVLPQAGSTVNFPPHSIAKSNTLLQNTGRTPVPESGKLGRNTG